MQTDASANRPAKVYFTCPACKGTNHWDVGVAPYALSEASPKDRIGVSTTVVSCPDCISTEYTIVIENHGSSENTYIREYPEIDVHLYDYEVTRYDALLANYIPPDAYHVFRSAKADVDNMIDKVDDALRLSMTFLSMAFLKYISMTEAYLSDRLIKIVMDDRAAMLRLIQKTEVLRDEKIEFIKVAADPNFVINKVKIFLQNVSFHDFGKVNKLYASVYQDTIMSDAALSYFITMIGMRHDFVHRNGRDKDGNFVQIEFETLFDFALRISELVDQCELKYLAYNDGRPMDNPAS